MLSDDEWNRNIRETIRKFRPETTDEELDLFDSSSSHWGNENYRTSSNWVQKSVYLIKEPSKFTNSEIFINLNGLLEDIPDFLRKKTIMFRHFEIKNDEDAKAFISLSRDVQIREHLEILWETYKIGASIKKLLSDDEHFLLGFFRHRFCHPTLDGYAVKIVAIKDQEVESGKVKFKTENWKRLTTLGANTEENLFKAEVLKRLSPLVGQIQLLANKFYRLSL